MKYNYHLIVFRPSQFMRVDQVAVGIAVRTHDGVDIHMPYQSKISTLLPSMTPRIIEDARKSMVSMASFDPDSFMEELPHMQLFCAIDPKMGWFKAESNQDYEMNIQDILSRTVITPKLKHPKVSTCKLSTELKRSFKDKGFLGKALGDIDKHLIIQGFPISESEDLYADFAYKNGVYHIMMAADFRTTQSKTTQQAKAALKAITMLEGKKKLKGKSYAIYAASIGIEDKIQPVLSMLNDYSNGNIFNYNSTDDMQKYYEIVDGHLSKQLIAS